MTVTVKKLVQQN